MTTARSSTCICCRRSIFAGHGHGPDWRRVFGAVEFEEVWRAVATALLTAPVDEIRDLGDLGFTCRVVATLTLSGRTADVRTSWHYADEDAPPRLVTAFPTT